MVRHVLEATHHPLVPEVVRKRLRPLGQQLHQLRRHLAETDLKKHHMACQVTLKYTLHHLIAFRGAICLETKSEPHDLYDSNSTKVATVVCLSETICCYYLFVCLFYCSH